MDFKRSQLIKLLVIQCLSISVLAQQFDFSYFVQEWHVSSCDSKRSCCYPTTGRPAEDFGIHGLWPNYNNGTYPRNCNNQAKFNQTEVSDLICRMQKDWPTLSCPSADGIKFWRHEWKKHGTCTSLDQHSYFKAALDLKDKANLLQVLADAGIRPGNFYSEDSIKKAIEEGVGYAPFVECNVDLAGNYQLFQVHLCVDTSASSFIECPIFPSAQACGSNSSIEFPSFSGESILYAEV